MGPIDLELRFGPGSRAPEVARRGLDALRVGFDDATVDQTVLLVSELVTNSVRHADLGPSDTIWVEVREQDRSLHVEVSDPGWGFEPDPQPRDDGGWGLWLVDRVSARWGVRQGERTSVWFELDPVSLRGHPGTGGNARPDQEADMGEMTDKAKGHAKEAVGDMTDNERLEREGKVDQASGEVKGWAEDAKDKVEEGVESARRNLNDD
jgi:uncharacterized protein YjbJ (UPF0337 family)